MIKDLEEDINDVKLECSVSYLDVYIGVQCKKLLKLIAVVGEAEKLCEDFSLTFKSEFGLITKPKEKYETDILSGLKTTLKALEENDD